MDQSAIVATHDSEIAAEKSKSENVQHLFCDMIRLLSEKDLLTSEFLEELMAVLGDEGMQRMVNLGKPILYQKADEKKKLLDSRYEVLAKNLEYELSRWGNT